MKRRGNIHYPVRGIEPPGYLHLPKIGQVPIRTIAYFVNEGSSYAWVHFVGNPTPKLLSEGTAYWQKQLPYFIRCVGPKNKVTLLNPIYHPNKI
jgi:hypothetical protein